MGEVFPKRWGKGSLPTSVEVAPDARPPAMKDRSPGREEQSRGDSSGGNRAQRRLSPVLLSEHGLARRAQAGAPWKAGAEKAGAPAERRRGDQGRHWGLRRRTRSRLWLDESRGARPGPPPGALGGRARGTEGGRPQSGGGGVTRAAAAARSSRGPETWLSSHGRAAPWAPPGWWAPARSSGISWQERRPGRRP